MAGHPRPTGEDCDLTKIDLVCPAARLSLLTAFPSSSPNSPANDPEPQSLLLVSKGVGRPKLTQLKQRASYFTFSNHNAFNLIIDSVDCFPDCLQAYSKNVTGKRCLSFLPGNSH